MKLAGTDCANSVILWEISVLCVNVDFCVCLWILYCTAAVFLSIIWSDLSCVRHCELICQFNSVYFISYAMEKLLPPPRRICFRHCLSVCLFVSNFVKKFRTDLHEIYKEGWQWASEQMVKFLWQSGSRIWIRIGIVTLIRHALVEVCTVPVLLVNNNVIIVYFK